PDDDPVGTHPQRIDDQLPDADPPGPVDPRRPRLETDLVRLAELELRGILDRDHTLGVRNERREDVQGGCLPGAGATRDQDIEMRLDARDRKSTRLNSSHQIISYAVFCLKKKKL